MRSSILFVVGLCAVLAFSATAAAQSASLSLSGPESPLTVTAGQSTSAAVDVTFIFDEGGCSQDRSVPVTVTVSASRLTPTPSPAQLSFTIPAGLYSGSASDGNLPAHNETQSTTINVPVSSGQSSGFSDTITVTASSPTIPTVNQTDPTQSSGCGPSDIPSAEGSTSISVQVQPDVVDDGDGDDGDDGGDGDNGGTPPPTNGDDGDDEEDNGVPVAPWVAPLALLGAAIALRTRR